MTYVDRDFTSTKRGDYKEVFQIKQANIAVYLGKASGGLCAIDFDADEDLDLFLSLNPKLAKSTRSRACRGGMVWARIAGQYPESCNPEHKKFEWRADNRLSTICGRHKAGMDYTLVVDAAPVSIRFEDIVWPEAWELPWIGKAVKDAFDALARQYGQPFYINKEGHVTGINERYWAGLYARENRVLYDPDEKSFYIYHDANGLWRPVTSDSIRESISARILEASRETRESSLEIQIKHAKLKAIAAALMGIVEKRGAFNTKQRLIHLANGVIRFSENGDVQLGGFAPADFSRNQSPFAFDPEAECPRFLNELIYPAVSEDDADLIQRWAGLALFGYNLPQRFLILDGTPNGGKGTLVRIIQALVGVENTYQLRTQFLDDRFEEFRYRGKTLLIGPDVPGDFLMRKGAARLKVLVGGDPLSPEAKGSNGDFQMFGTFNIVMTCNSRLRIQLEEDARAWRRRLLVVRYEKPPAVKRLLELHATLLREEGSGILRWALSGFVRLQAEFAERGDFALSDAQWSRIDSLLAESDSLRLFVRQRIKRHESGALTVSEFQQAYAGFCAEKCWTAQPLTFVERGSEDIMLEVWQVAKSHSIERDGKANRGWKKVRLISAEEES